MNKYIFSDFLNFWPLEAGMEYSGPEIRILRKISSPEPAGKPRTNPEKPRRMPKGTICISSTSGLWTGAKRHKRSCTARFKL